MVNVLHHPLTCPRLTLDCHFKEGVPFQVAAKTALQEGVRVTFRKVSYTFMKIGTHVQLTNESVLKASMF